MTLNATVAGPYETVEAVPAESSAVPANTERRDAIIFFVFAFALVGAMIAAALTVGMAGVGMIAIIEAFSMIVVCLLLTAG